MVFLLFFVLGQERKGVKTKSIALLGILSLAPRPPFFFLKTQGSGSEFDRRQMFWGRVVSSAGTERLHVGQCPSPPLFLCFFSCSPPTFTTPQPPTPRRRRCGVTGARKWPENMVGRSHTSEGGGRGRRGRRLEGANKLRCICTLGRRWRRLRAPVFHVDEKSEGTSRARGRRRGDCWMWSRAVEGEWFRGKKKSFFFS